MVFIAVVCNSGLFQRPQAPESYSAALAAKSGKRLPLLMKSIELNSKYSTTIAQRVKSKSRGCHYRTNAGFSKTNKSQLSAEPPVRFSEMQGAKLLIVRKNRRVTDGV
jgi:hypothetical protein